MISNRLLHFLERDDLSAVIKGVIGDCTGPGSDYDQLRQRRAHYLLSHWIEPESFLGLLKAGQQLVKPRGVALDLGCAVGRGTFEAATHGAELVLGIDMDFSMLRKASRLLRQGTQRLDRRRIGLVYEPVELSGPAPGAERVDFWLADALMLPIQGDRVDTISSYNLLDCLSVPSAHFAVIAALLRQGGEAVVGCPHDWTAHVPVEAWIGGHSQRAPDQGRAEPRFRALVAHHGLNVTGEVEAPWQLRLHDRSVMSYQVQLMGMRKEAAAAVNT